MKGAFRLTEDVCLSKYACRRNPQHGYNAAALCVLARLPSNIKEFLLASNQRAQKFSLHGTATSNPSTNKTLNTKPCPPCLHSPRLSPHILVVYKKAQATQTLFQQRRCWECCRLSWFNLDLVSVFTDQHWLVMDGKEFLQGLPADKDRGIWMDRFLSSSQLLQKYTFNPSAEQ